MFHFIKNNPPDHIPRPYHRPHLLGLQLGLQEQTQADMICWPVDFPVIYKTRNIYVLLPT